ncbi:MAG: hypothetical protein ACRDDY_10215 [Clostridium sp.]|uniref:hypothetical protein n=1 Tax=Clostridium sp. TaxID=1506 RepID=UPI003EE7935E
MNKKIVSLLGVSVLSMTLLTGCMTDSQKELNVADGRSNPWFDMDGRDGGDYVVINSSGGTVYDVWKLEDKLVSSIDGSDGWEFIDSKGNFTRVGGDCLVIRCNDKETFDLYEEYHWNNKNKESM